MNEREGELTRAVVTRHSNNLDGMPPISVDAVALLETATSATLLAKVQAKAAGAQREAFVRSTAGAMRKLSCESTATKAIDFGLDPTLAYGAIGG